MESQNKSKPTTTQITAPFRCSHSSCEKTFLRREHLTRHEKGHGSDKPFKCHLCPKEFTRSDILKRHIALHSNPAELKRTLVACKNCRRRKLKCDANSPCATCVSRQLECEREEISPQSQLSSTDLSKSSPDAGITDCSVSMMDLSIDKFGEGGWCPERSVQKFTVTLGKHL